MSNPAPPGLLTRMLLLIGVFVLPACVGHVNDDLEQEGIQKQQAMSLEDFLQQGNLQRYVGKTVRALLVAAPEKYKEYHPIDEPPGKLIGFSVSFSNGYNVEIYCYDLSFVKKFNEQRTWDFEGFQKEIISDITVERIRE